MGRDSNVKMRDAIPINGLRSLSVSTAPLYPAPYRISEEVVAVRDVEIIISITI